MAAVLQLLYTIGGTGIWLVWGDSFHRKIGSLNDYIPYNNNDTSIMEKKMETTIIVVSMCFSIILI